MQVVVGRVGRAHGIRGDVTVELRTDFPERRFAAGSVLTGGDRTFTVKSAREHSRRWLVRFEEVPDRTAAEQLGGIELTADVPDNETLDGDDYFDRELIGLDVYTSGHKIGAVVGVEHLGAQDALVIAIKQREVLVPFVAALVDVDLDAGRVDVADRPGLLDPTTADEA